MSLDVYLTLPGAPKREGSGIYVREDGQTREITREEWDRRFPSVAPYVVDQGDDTPIYEANITHNLAPMAREAGVYEVLWRPEKVGITLAVDLIPPLTTGLAILQSDPDRFRLLNPPNGWGSYEGLVSFVRNYLDACQRYPQALVSAWR